MGSGTTGHACANLGRAFVGIERDAAYYAIAERRIADAADPLRHMTEAA
jgi:site-specific DNA-methyltransferase (adenine-specific)